MKDLVTAIARDGLWHMLHGNDDMSLAQLRDLSFALQDFAHLERGFHGLKHDEHNDCTKRCSYGKRLIFEVIHFRFCQMARREGFRSSKGRGRLCDHWLNATHLLLWSYRGWDGTDEEIWQTAMEEQSSWVESHLDTVAECHGFDLRSALDRDRPTYI